MNRDDTSESGARFAGPFARLGSLFTLVTTTILLGNVLLVANLTDRQAGDSQVINLSGRQRMLSQRIAKTSAQLVRGRELSADRIDAIASELERSIDEWIRADRDLRDRPGDRIANSEAAVSLFERMQPHFDEMVSAARELLSEPPEGQAEYLSRIEMHEAQFLPLMDELVSLYATEARTRVADIHRMQIGILVLSVLVLFAGILLALGWFTSRDAESRNAMELATERKEWAERSMLRYGELERERFGQELHDGVCQMLTGVQMMLKRGEDADLKEIESLLSQTSRQAHALARGAFIKMLNSRGLGHALTEAGMALADAYRKPLHVDIDGDLDHLPPTVALHIYRAGQEAISNALRHSNAKTISVTGRRLNGAVELIVADDGDGFDTNAVADGLGLAGLQARASLGNGELEIDSTLGGGTRVRFALPVGQVMERRRAI